MDRCATPRHHALWWLNHGAGGRLITVALALLVASCGGGTTASKSSTVPSPSSTATSTASSPTPATAATAPQSSAGTAPAALCTGLTARKAGAVADPALTELSGMVASRRHPGVLWAHNDSGHDAALFAVGPNGANKGEFPLPSIAEVDTEDIALMDGTIYLGDIGDNDSQRPDVALYRVPEPDPAATGTARRVTRVDTLRFRYPDHAHDAEALLVDPTSGQVVIITKELGFGSGADRLIGPAPARIFTADPPFTPGGTVTLQAAGTLAADQLDRRATATPAPGRVADLGVGGLVTGADISADGRVIAVRTYATIWLFDRPTGTTIAQALAGAPCEAPSRPEPQGEAIAILPGPGLQLTTSGEGVRPDLNLISR